MSEPVSSDVVMRRYSGVLTGRFAAQNVSFEMNSFRSTTFVTVQSKSMDLARAGVVIAVLARMMASTGGRFFMG